LRRFYVFVVRLFMFGLVISACVAYVNYGIGWRYGDYCLPESIVQDDGSASTPCGMSLEAERTCWVIVYIAAIIVFGLGVDTVFLQPARYRRRMEAIERKSSGIEDDD
jgi:hypothetical protein